MKKIIFIATVILGIVCLSGCESTQRQIKSIQSDLGGGLDRTVFYI